MRLSSRFHLYKHKGYISNVLKLVYYFLNFHFHLSYLVWCQCVIKSDRFIFPRINIWVQLKPYVSYTDIHVWQWGPSIDVLPRWNPSTSYMSSYVILCYSHLSFIEEKRKTTKTESGCWKVLSSTRKGLKKELCYSFI